MTGILIYQPWSNRIHHIAAGYSSVEMIAVVELVDTDLAIAVAAADNSKGPAVEVAVESIAVVGQACPRMYIAVAVAAVEAGLQIDG
jgi:hypothetical protein